MSFRLQLTLAILSLVVIATAASLAVALQQSEATARAMVDNLLRQQEVAFQREQESRHALAMTQVTRLAGSVRLFAALEENAPEVYEIASDELRLGDFVAFRLQNAHGDIIPPPADGRAGHLPLAFLEPGLFPASAAGAPDQVALGFAYDRRAPAEHAVLYRVLAAPVVNFGTRVGTLILVQHLSRFGREGLDDTADEALQASLWTAGQLNGGRLPDAVRQALARRLAATAAAPLDGEIAVGGTTYRYRGTLLNADSAYPPAWLVSVHSMAAFAAARHGLVVQTALAGLGISLVAGFAAGRLARQFANPVAALVKATRRIRGGDYAVELAPAGPREMRALAGAFTDMAAGLAQKERYQSLLAQVADPEVATALVEGRVRLGGELREVTVMFCDVRDYTALTRDRAPEDVIELLNAHLAAMARVVHAHRGVINQFAGDAVMALFGAPRSYGEDALRAVRCAAGMLAERSRLNATAIPAIHVGIGIATGHVVAGCIGAEHRSDYTVVGERVNLAARLSAAAPPDTILIDPDTYARVADTIACEPLPPLNLKGFGTAVAAYRVGRRDSHA